MLCRLRWSHLGLRSRGLLAGVLALALIVGLGLPATLAGQPAQASTAPVLEFKRDTARASWVSGPGGNYFGVWQCPQGSLAVGVRGAEASGYVYRFGLVCRYINLNDGSWGAFAFTPTTQAGATTQLLCPQGQALVRVDVWTMTTFGYHIASETEPYCQTLNFGDLAASPRQVPELNGPITHAPDRYFGVRHGRLYGSATCGAGKFVIAIDGRRGALLDGLGIYCGRFTSAAASIANVTLSGSTQFGMPVTATSTAAGGPAPTMTYQWYRCDTADATTQAVVPDPPECELITGATDQAYLPQITDYGKHLRVAATATNYFGSATRVSATTPAPAVPVPTIDLPDDQDSGLSATDNHTNVKQPNFTIGRLVPTALVTVTATKGAETHTCTFTAAGVPNDMTGAPATGGCAPPVDLSDGTWTVTASQTYTPMDADDSPLTPITPASASMNLVIDATPPVIGAINLRLGGSTGTSITDGRAIAVGVSNTFWLGRPTATDAHTGTVITCSIDGGPYTVCPTSYRNLTSGSHTLTVRAIDKAGNVATSDHTWFVVTPPVVNLDPASDSGHSNTDTNTNDNTPRILVSGLVVGATVTVTATRSGQSNRTCTFTATTPTDGCDDWKIGAATADLSDGTWRYSATQRYDPGSGTAATSSVSNYRNVIIDTQTPTFTRWSSSNNGGTILNGNVVRSVPSWTHHIRPIWADQPVSNGYLWNGTCSHNGGSLRTLTSTSTTHVCSVVGPPSGLHTMVFTRTDIAGNQATPQTFQWTVLNTPVLALDPASDTGSSNSDHITADNTPTMQVGDLAPGATVTVTATRSGFPTTTCTFTAPAAVAPATASSGSCDLPELGDATGWSIRASQSMPQTAPSTATVTQWSNIIPLTIDTRRPVPALPTLRAGTSSGPIIANESVTAQTTAWISAVSNVTGETRQCRLDSVVIPCPTRSTAFPNLSTGPHTFEVIATDRAGNVGISSTTWRVLGKPVVSLDASSDTGSSDSDRITRDNTPQINVSDLSGGGGAVTVTATKSGSTPLTCTFVATSTSGQCDLPDAVDGTWSVTAVESVRVGASTVTSAAADPISVTIDTVTPTKPTAGFSVNGIAVTPGSVIEMGSGVTSGALTFTAGPSSEAGATLLCSLNGATAVPCPADGFAGVPNGMNTLTVTAVDLAGNTSSTTSQWFQVPAIVLGLDPSSSLKTDSNGNVLSGSRTQSVNASGFVAGELVTVTAISNGNNVTCTYTPDLDGNGGCSLTFPDDGVWSISASQTITQKDDDGNDLPPVTTTTSLDPLTVDTTAPVLTSELRNAADLVVGTSGSETAFKTSETTLSLSATATDLTATIITCALNGAAAGPCPAELTNLSYGVQTLVVTATDAVGNTSTDTLTWHVTAPPTVALVASSDTGKSDSDGVTNDTTPTITVGNLGEDVDVVVTATKGAETVTCYLWHANEFGPTPGTASCDFGSLVDGSWTITATQTISGRPEWISPVSSPLTVVVDSIAPSTPTATFTHLITPGAVTTQTSIDFVTGPISNDASVIDYTCSLNGSAPASCDAFTNLPAGSHRLVYTATDLAGNSSAGTLAWTIIAPPSVSLRASSDTGSSNSDGVTSDALPVIEVSDLIPGATATVTATRGGVSVSCVFIAGPPPTPTAASSTGDCQLPTLPTDGAWTVTATQSLGGTSSVPSGPTIVTLDTMAPATGTPTTVVIDGVTYSVLENPDITGVAGGSSVPTGGGTESSSITLTLPDGEAGSSRVCTLDGAPVDCAFTTLNGLATGLHTYTITDTDLAGNTATQSYVWSVVGPPTVALDPASDSGSADRITNIDTPEFSAGALIDGATVEITATRGALSRSCTFVAVDGITSCELPPLADGDWSVSARQGFGSGWSAPSSAVNITIDATAPTDIAVTLTSGGKELTFTDGDETGTASAALTVGAPTSTDASAVTYTCSLDGGAAGPCAATYASLPAGKHTLTVTATDVAGNVSELVRAWTIVAPPIVALAEESDTGIVGDGETSETEPSFELSNLMPGATVTVTAKRGGVTRTCTFVAPTAVAPSTSSTSSCELDGPLEGTGWIVRATQIYVTSVSEPDDPDSASNDPVTLNSGESNIVSLDIVLPQPLSITVPPEVKLEEETIFVQVENVAVPTNAVNLTSLTPTVCTEANGEINLLNPGKCILRGEADRWVDSSAGLIFGVGRETASFQVVGVASTPETPAEPAMAGPPINTTAVLEAGRVVVAWQPPASSGAFPVTTYQVVSSDGLSCMSVTLSCSFAAGRVSSSTTFMVRALTGAGWSTWSNTASVDVPDDVDGVAPCETAATCPDPADPGDPESPDRPGDSPDSGNSGGDGEASPGRNPVAAPRNPEVVRVLPGPKPGVSRVRVDLPASTKKRPVETVVIVVRDANGLVIRQVVVDVSDHGKDTVTRRVRIPEGGSVRVFTTNAAGVSSNAPREANVVEASTIRGYRPDGRPILYGKKIAKPVFFGPDSPELDQRARRILDRVAAYVGRNGGTVLITGFVRKGNGSEQVRQQLSSARGQQVASYLSGLGVETWIRYDGAGAYREVDTKVSDRRVEIRWSKRGIPSAR